MKIFLAVLKFLFLGALLIISNQQLYLTDSEDFGQFRESYVNWLGDVFDFGKEITVFVVKSNWVPDSSTSLS